MCAFHACCRHRRCAAGGASQITLSAGVCTSEFDSTREEPGHAQLYVPYRVSSPPRGENTPRTGACGRYGDRSPDSPFWVFPTSLFSRGPRGAPRPRPCSQPFDPARELRRLLPPRQVGDGACAPTATDDDRQRHRTAPRARAVLWSDTLAPWLALRPASATRLTRRAGACPGTAGVGPTGGARLCPLPMFVWWFTSGPTCRVAQTSCLRCAHQTRHRDIECSATRGSSRLVPERWRCRRPPRRGWPSPTAVRMCVSRLLTGCVRRAVRQDAREHITRFTEYKRACRAPIRTCIEL